MADEAAAAGTGASARAATGGDRTRNLLIV